MAVTESSQLASREIDDLYRAHLAEVYRYAYAVLGNHADAEDVTQTTFLNAYRALEQGVRPRKPANWLLTIASNAIKQRFRHERSRPRQVELDDRIADPAGEENDDGPTVGELLTALSKIPPQQRQALVLREFEGRSYAEIAEILGVTTSALETLLFRARRSLAEELQHQLTCTDAQLAVSRSVDGRLGRKERRRLRDHIAECPDCAGFARMQQRHRSALRGLALVPIPVSLTLFKGFEGTASAAVFPLGAGTAATGGAVAVGAGATATGTTGGLLAGGIGMKAAAVVAAASVAGGAGVVGASKVDGASDKTKPAAGQPGQRVGQVAPRGVLVPGNGVAVGKASAPGQVKAPGTSAKAVALAKAEAKAAAAKAKAAAAKASAHGQSVSRAKREAAPRKGAGGNASANPSASAAKPKPTASAPGSTPRNTSPATGKESAKQETPARADSQPPASKSGATAEKGNGGAGGPKG